MTDITMGIPNSPADVSGAIRKAAAGALPTAPETEKRKPTGVTPVGLGQRTAGVDVDVSRAPSISL